MKSKTPITPARKTVKPKRIKLRNKEKPAHVQIKPRLKWQVGDYERHAEYKFMLPYEFLLICKLFEVTPRDVLSDFLYAVSCGSVLKEKRESRTAKAVDYFLECGYGTTHYTDESKREMLRQLNNIGFLWPSGSKMKMIDLHAKWRDSYLNYWFKKWYRKPRRKV